MPVVYIHVVWCCTVVLRPWVQFGPGICVSRSLQSFGEATRLPRMPVACRSVPVRLFWCRYIAMMESCVASLWRHCTWSHSCPITSTCTCALCVLTLRRCFPPLAGVFVLLAVVWRTRATGRLSEVLGFVVYNCWPCPLSSWFLRNFWFPELVEVAASLFLALFLCWLVTTFAL